MNNTIEEIHSKIPEGDAWGGNHCHKTEKKKKRMKRNEDGLRDLWKNIKHTNIFIMGFQKEKNERKDLRKYLKR